MRCTRMIELMNPLVPKEGIAHNLIEKVNLFRITNSYPRTPQCYEPSIIVIAQDQKKVFLNNEIIIYDPVNYLVLSVPLPIECETTASSEKPKLGLQIKVDAATGRNTSFYR